MSEYGWGLDGFGRAFIDRKDDPERKVIFCVLPGFNGSVGVWELEDQDNKVGPYNTEEINERSIQKSTTTPRD